VWGLFLLASLSAPIIYAHNCNVVKQLFNVLYDDVSTTLAMYSLDGAKTRLSDDQQHNKRTDMQKMSIKTTLIFSAAAAFLATQTAFAQIPANDLILGFNQQGVSSSDYTVDLGNAANILGASRDLSSSINMSLFNQAFSSPNGVAAGIAGGNSGIGTKDVFVTQFRDLTVGNPVSLGGSATPTQPSSASFISTAAASVNSVSPLGVNPSGGTTSWSAQVAPNASDTTGTPFLNAISVNPMGVISSSSIVLDLWQDNRSGSTGQTGWFFDGFFTLTFTGPNSETLTFTPVPEPGTYGFVAGAGLLALCLRRQLVGKSA
jgi:hypothetical protein